MRLKSLIKNKQLNLFLKYFNRKIYFNFVHLHSQELKKAFYLETRISKTNAFKHLDWFSKIPQLLTRALYVITQNGMKSKSFSLTYKCVILSRFLVFLFPTLSCAGGRVERALNPIRMSPFTPKRQQLYQIAA